MPVPGKILPMGGHGAGFPWWQTNSPGSLNVSPKDLSSAGVDQKPECFPGVW